MSSVRSKAADRSASGALVAFLRGVERRAAVLAEAHCGEAQRADAAVARTLAGFRAAARKSPMAEWPRLFWSLLLAQPELTAPPVRSPAVIAPGLGPGLRAALLLWLVAGLEEEQAAAVLGTNIDALRRAVARAAPRMADGDLDEAAWRALQSGLQQRIRSLPPARLARLVQARSAAVRRWPAAPGWLSGRRRLLGAGLGALLLATAAGLWWQARPSAEAIEPLPPAGPPASTYDATAGLVAHPDFDMLAYPDESTLALDAAFLGWLAAGAPAAPGLSPDDEDRRVPQADPLALPSTEPESADAP